MDHKAWKHTESPAACTHLVGHGCHSPRALVLPAPRLPRRETPELGGLGLPKPSLSPRNQVSTGTTSKGWLQRWHSLSCPGGG